MLYIPYREHEECVHACVVCVCVCMHVLCVFVCMHACSMTVFACVCMLCLCVCTVDSRFVKGQVKGQPLVSIHSLITLAGGPNYSVVLSEYYW